jgi:hypothetical protein
MAHPSHGALLRRVPALALAVVLALGASSAALAQSERQEGDVAALATERYYSSYGTGAAAPIERYYSSYGAPEPLERPATAAAAAGNDGPGWTATIVVGALLALAAAGLGAIAGRATRRPRQARA